MDCNFGKHQMTQVPNRQRRLDIKDPTRSLRRIACNVSELRPGVRVHSQEMKVAFRCLRSCTDLKATSFHKPEGRVPFIKNAYSRLRITPLLSQIYVPAKQLR